ncbi:hypothetical protein AB4865_09000 [Capnocytophaga sp. ARDL2]|uniref:type IX secretion system anionic LPS delivery protein PorZ n=1 Tax=Capnocytophaga sp. ARDL2 TaxID=3238809 RepID=UPI003556A1EF
MKQVVQALLLGVSLTSFSQKYTEWKDYYSYNQIVEIDAEYSKTFYATENSVIIHNDITNEKEIFNSINGLKIADITTMAYSPTNKKIIVGNAKGEIALISVSNGNVQYINDIVNKSNLLSEQKKITKIVVRSGNAYIATGYGVSKFLLNSNTFGDTYYLGENGTEILIKDVAVSNQYLFVIDENGHLRRGKISENLVNVNKWATLSNEVWDNIEILGNELYAYRNNALFKYNGSTFVDVKLFDATVKEMTVFGNNLTLIFEDKMFVLNTSNTMQYNFQSVENLTNFTTGIYKNPTYSFVGTNENGLYNSISKQKISPEGPYSNKVIKVRNSPNNELWFLYGGHRNYNPYPLIKAPISFLRNNKWEFIPTEQHNIPAVSDVAFPPFDDSIMYITSFYTGIIEVKNYKQSVNDFEYKFYNAFNGYPISAMHIDNSVRVNGISFDSEGNGWFMSSLAPNELHKFDKNHNFTSYHLSSDFSDSFKPVVDKNGTVWAPTRGKGLFGFNEKQSNKLYVITTENGLVFNFIESIAVDKNNQLWIGGFSSLRILPNVNQFLTSNNLTVTPIIFEENGIGSELFEDQNISQIKVDGANNKWIAVADAGVFCVSYNGQETLHHFDTTNSPLLSNNIHSIEINELTGEVIFGTEKGVVSFFNPTSSTTRDNLDELYAFPNPMRPEFVGDVKIVGLTERSNVKIADVAGNLVYEIVANSGTITWDTRDFFGNKVPSGVYTVFVSDNQGAQIGTTKIAIVR